MTSSPKKPEKTSEQISVERRQSMLLNEEIEEGEERLKALARGKLGRSSLLTGAPTTPAQAARGGRGTGASMFSGGGNSGGGGIVGTSTGGRTGVGGGSRNSGGNNAVIR